MNARYLLGLGLLCGALGAACNQTTIRTPIRSFDRPTDIALSCLQFDPVSQLYGPRKLDDCKPERLDALKLTDTDGVEYKPRLYGLVTNSARGELAMVDLNSAQIIDLDRRVPGFGFVPIGKMPERVRTSRDGCIALSANVDSCDLGRVELGTLYNMPFKSVAADGGATFGDGVVHRLVPTIAGQPVGARPTWVELALESQDAVAPFDAGGTAGTCTGGSYRAWVAMPGCGLIAEVDVNLTNAQPNGEIRAEMIRALRFAGGAPTWVSDLSSIQCLAECKGEEPSSANPARPVSFALVDDGSAVRMLIADQKSEMLTIATLDRATGEPGALRQIALESGAQGLNVVKASPRGPAGRFAYAVARDSSVRVVDLDREVECDTAIDARLFGTIPAADPRLQARTLGCFPVGDPATPRRAARSNGPGIRLPGDSIPTDVAFVHLDVAPPATEGATPLSAAPTFLVGDFAWVTSSDGRAALIQIYDGCPAPNVPVTADNSFTVSCALENVDKSRIDAFVNAGHPVPLTSERLSHRVRGGSNRFFVGSSLVDAAGSPRLQDANNVFSLTVNGAPAGEQTLPDGTKTRALPRLRSELVPKPDYVTTTDELRESVRFPDPRAVFNQTWLVSWEGILPTTRRTLGRPLANGLFRDTGAAFCQRGVQSGDKIDFLGCTRDADCNRNQVCIRDPGAPVDVQSGLCLESTNELEKLEQTCAPLLRAFRQYRIVRARQEVPLETGERADELQLAEIYEPEYSVQTHACSDDTQCEDVTIRINNLNGTVTSLPTQCLLDSDGQSRCLRRCNAAATGVEAQCGPGYLCAASRQGDDRCMRAPLNDGLIATCMTELQRYEIRAGSSFLVTGTTAGAPAEMRIDPVTRDCVPPPPTDETGRLQRPRIPLEPAACPMTMTDSLAMVDSSNPNVCLYASGPVYDATDTEKKNPKFDRVYHFENPQVTFALAVPTEAPIPPDNTTLSFIVVGGNFPFTVQLLRGNVDGALLPRVIATAPDGQTLYIVDEGKQTTSTGLRGQVLLFNSSSQSIDSRFVVR